MEHNCSSSSSSTLSSSSAEKKSNSSSGGDVGNGDNRNTGAAGGAVAAGGSPASDLTSKLIVFKADQKTICYETNRHPDVTVIGSTGLHDHGSSKVKLKSIVDYKWDLRHYPGRLITVHIDGKHIAYAILVRTNEGMVRVVNPSNGHRALIKGMRTQVLDLQFAHIRNLMVLASIEENALHLHRVDSAADKITCTALLYIEDTAPLLLELGSGDSTSVVGSSSGASGGGGGGAAAAAAALHRLNWCPYVPEKETEIDEYVSQQLVWVRGSQFRCYSVRSVVNAYGVGSRLIAEQVEGTLTTRETAPITGASFSPDGTTLCVSGEDGVIRFYQVYFHTNEPTPRCLHQWTPHEGRPISAFFFLDNLTMYSKDKSLWRHAITACNNNTEIKVWCCSTWECLQTVHFVNAQLQMNAQIDRTSSYLVLSDSKSRGLYVLQVQIDAGGSPPRNHAEALLGKRLQDADASADAKATAGSAEASLDGDRADDGEACSSSSSESQRSVAYIKSISEFPLSQPILSYHIVDAAVRRYKCAFNDSYLLEELDDYDEENHSLYCVVINMYLVQPKSVQECHVLYQPSVDEDAEVLSSMENVRAAIEDKPGNDSNERPSSSTQNGTNASSTSNETATTPLSSKSTAANAVDQEVPSLSAAAVSKASPKPELNAAIAAPPLTAAAAPATTPITLEDLMAKAPASLQALDAAKHMAQLAAASKVAMLSNRSPGAINLLTPDSFSASAEIVSSGVRSALQMLAQSQQQPPSAAATVATRINRPLTADEMDELRDMSKIMEENTLENLESITAMVAAQGRNSVELNSQILPPECGASLLAAAAAAASGGSSPSREVQQILSPKDSDLINDFFDDSTDLDEDNDLNSADTAAAEKKDVDLLAQYNLTEQNRKCSEILRPVARHQHNSNGKTQPPQQQPHQDNIDLVGKESNDTKAPGRIGKGGDWPKVPDLPTSLSNMRSANFSNNISAAAADAPDGGVATGEVLPAVALAACTAAAERANAETVATVKDLSNKLEQMMEIMRTQTGQIVELRTAVVAERKRNEEVATQVATHVEKRLARMYEEQMQRTNREQTQRLDEYKKMQIVSQAELRTTMVQQISQAVSTLVSDRITKLLLGELQQRIVPLIVSRLDQIKLQVQSDVAHKLTVCDSLLRDNITRLCTNKATMETFGTAIMVGVQTSLQSTYSDTMKETLIPAYEQASGEMFRQVQEVFVNGTKAYSKLFEDYFSQYEPVHENIGTLVSSLPDQLKVHADAALANSTAKLHAELQRDLKAMTAQLVQTVRDNVKNEVKKCFDAQTATIEDSVRSAVVRSQTQTPAPSVYDVQEQIRMLLAQGQVNTAFHQALVANDLQLVEYTIEKADFGAVFNPCPLQQTVLLSLIQQISADMTNHNELKQRYMAEAILNLNMQDATTKEHAPKVLRELFHHCQAYIVANPSSQHIRGIRMLMMALQGLLSVQLH